MLPCGQKINAECKLAVKERATMFFPKCVLMYIKVVTLLVFFTSFFQVFSYGMPLEQAIDGSNVYAGLNESTINASLPEMTPISFDVLAGILALKYQLNLLFSLSHSDPKGKKVSIHPYSDIRSFVSVLWSQRAERENISTLSYSTNYDRVQTTPIYIASNGDFQGHELVKVVKGSKTPSTEPRLPPTSLSPFSQNYSNTKVTRKIGQHFENGLHSSKKGYSSSEHLLGIAVESENFTFVYPGSDKGRQFFESDAISLKDDAFNKKRTWFQLKLGDTTGEAFMDSPSVLPELQTLYCMVSGNSEEIIYGGWHRWGNETVGLKSLSCESACKSAGVDPFTTTSYHLHTDNSSSLMNSEQRNIRVKQVICLQPTYSGLYLCIAVDAKYNVFLSATHDIRIVNVVRSTDSNITPPLAIMRQNDTRQSFINRYCAGYFSPRQNADKYSAQEVDFFYINETKNDSVSFSVKTLHTQKWTKAAQFLENLNFVLPAIIRCKFDIQTFPYSESRYVELYYRLTGGVSKTQSSITAVRDEAFKFYCFEDTFESSTPAYVSYSEGICSQNETAYNSPNSSNIRLRINKEICVKCSSLTAEIQLQINFEQDLRTLIPNTVNEQLLGKCPVLENLHSKYFSVKNSDVCEQNAVSLLKGTKQYRNRVMLFTQNRYKSYYTSRQFIICQDKPISGPAVLEKQVVGPSQTGIVNIVLFSSVAIVAALLLFACKRKCPAKKLICKIKKGTKSNSISHSLKSSSARYIDNIINAMDRVHPRENIEQSRISIKDVIRLGKFGNIHKACLKHSINTDDENEVVVEELKLPTSRKEKKDYLRQMNQQIQVLRVITPHINILRYYGFSIGSESTLIVMEFVNGISLLDYLQEQRRHIPDFIFKTRNQTRAENRPDTTNTTCSSVDSEGSLISDNSHRERRYSINQHEPLRVTGHAQAEGASNERKDSNSSDGDSSMASVTHQGIWYVHFENDNSEYLRESNISMFFPQNNNRSTNESLVKEILSVYRQVARAMTHLSHLNIILCELETRSVMVQLREYPLVVKICDFRSAYRLQEGQTVYRRKIASSQKVKWLPPEVVKKGEFSVLSDVWFYGLFCWEVSTLGCLSYEKMQISTEAPKTNKRQSLPRPPGCDEEIFTVIESCWKITPDERPSFDCLAEKWSDILEVNSDYLELRSDLDDSEITNIL